MIDDRLDDLLREADASAPRRDIEPPRVADLERLHRRELVVRTGTLLLLLLAVTGVAWRAADRAANGDERVPDPRARIVRSLQDLQDTLASVRSRPETPSSTSESVALDTFEALQRGAQRGDPQSIEGLRWLAERFPRTHGGQCARLFLASNDRPPATTSGPTARRSTLDTHPKNR